MRHTIIACRKVCRLLLAFALLVVALAGFDHAVAEAQSDRASQVVILVNQLRATYGLPPYQVDAALTAAAQAHAEWCAANNTFGHTGAGGTSPNDRALAAGYGGGAWAYATENGEYGTPASYMTPEMVVQNWQNSPIHLSAMISPDYEHIGVGYTEARDTAWYFMMAGRVAGNAPPSSSAVRVSPTAESASFNPFVLSTPGPDGSITHTVQPGQTAWVIAAYYGVDLNELLALNGLGKDPILHPGDVLLVRPPTQPISTPVPLTPSEVTPANTSTPIPVPPPTEAIDDSGGVTGQPGWLSGVLVGLGIVVLLGLLTLAVQEYRRR